MDRELRQEVTEGLLYTHSRLNTNTRKTLETASFLYALVELLDEQGLISERLACTVWAHRPVPCRAFDCRRDGRIWLDFDAMVINPSVAREDWPAGEAVAGTQGGGP